MNIRYIGILVLFFLSTSCLTLKKNLPEEKDSQNSELKFIYLFDEANKNRLNGNLQKALEQYTAATEINPESAASYFYTAVIFAEKKDYSSAVVYSSKAVDSEPNNFWYNIQKADLLNITGKTKDAVTIYENLLKKYPKKEILYNKLSLIYLRNKDLKNLISVYERKQKNTDYSSETAEKLFNLYLKVKDYKKAEKTVFNLYKKYPENIRFQGMAAEYYYSVNQIVKAEEIYKELLSKYPENNDVNLSYALFCKKTNKKDEYFETTKKLMSSDIDFIKKTMMLTSGQYHNFPDNEYFILLTELYKKHPNEILSNTYFAEYYIEKNNKEKAIIYIRKSLELNPSDFNMALMLFSLTYDIKDFENLLKDTEKYKSYFPNRPEVFLYNGIANYKLNNFTEAEKSLKNGKFLVIENTNLEDQFNFYLSLIYKKERKFNQAIVFAKQILKHKNKDIKIYELYGDLLFLKGNKEQSLIYWKKAKENGNNSDKLINKIKNFEKLTDDEILK